MIYCRPAASCRSVVSPRKKSRNRDLTCIRTGSVSKPVPLKVNMGLRPTPTVWALKSRNSRWLTICSSIMSKSWYPNVRIQVRLLGRFLLDDEKTSRDVSFFSEKNSNEDTSSKGLISFFLLNRLPSGSLRAQRSTMASWRSWLEVWPGTNSACFVFSTILGSLASTARLARAFSVSLVATYFLAVPVTVVRCNVCVGENFTACINFYSYGCPYPDKME